MGLPDRLRVIKLGGNLLANRFVKEETEGGSMIAIEVENKTCADTPALESFLTDLTELSRKYKIGIAGDPVLFCLEDEDLDRTYSSDADSVLVY